MSTPFKLSIPKPCSADWNQMNVEEKSRHCDLCSQSVYSLEDFEASEAVDLLQQKVCVRIKSNERGEVKTRSGFSSMLLLSGLLACGETEMVGEPMPENYAVEQPVEALQITAGKPVQANLDEPPKAVMGKIAPPPELLESQKAEAVETVTLGDVVVHEEMGEAIMEKSQNPQGSQNAQNKETKGEDCTPKTDGGKTDDGEKAAGQTTPSSK